MIGNVVKADDDVCSSFSKTCSERGVGLYTDHIDTVLQQRESKCPRAGTKVEYFELWLQVPSDLRSQVIIIFLRLFHYLQNLSPRIGPQPKVRHFLLPREDCGDHLNLT